MIMVKRPCLGRRRDLYTTKLPEAIILSNQSRLKRQDVNNPTENDTSLVLGEPESNRLAVHGAPPNDSSARGLAPRDVASYPEEAELDLRHLLGMLVRRWKVMLAAFSVVVLATVIWTWTSTPIYQAKATIQVDSSKNKIAGGM